MEISQWYGYTTGYDSNIQEDSPSRLLGGAELAVSPFPRPSLRVELAA